MREYWRTIVLLALFILGSFTFFLSFSVTEKESPLRVVFFNVGQGDAIFIESPTGTQLLIDAGRDNVVLRGLAHELGFWDRTIDIALATHEDTDHIGGFPDVFSRYAISTFVRTENEGESGLAHMLDEIAPKEAEIIYARRGMEIDLGGGVVLHILFPDRDPTYLDSNTSSIVARLIYGDTSFLLTGDSPDEIEQHLVFLDSQGLQSDVLKAGHHGSRTSTSEAYMNAVLPTYAIISAEKDNRYGHPHEEVVERLRLHNATILSTAEKGTIAFESDGQTLSYKTY
jgi:competence protein ComEC